MTGIKVDLSADKIDQQIELLKVYPEVAESHYRPVLIKDVQILKDMILMDVPVLSGRAQKALGSKVTGKGVRLEGEVGWYGAKGRSAWYIRLVEGGTKSHAIEGYGSKGRGRTGMLSFSAGSERLVRKSVQHPGVSARHFMQAVWERAREMVTQDISIANDGIVKDLAL